MKIKVLTLIAAAFLMQTTMLKAQGYSTDAMLVENQNDKVAVIKCSGIDDKKKNAETMAVKSAIYTYLVSGIDGLNRGLPLLGTKPSSQAMTYVNNILESGRYNVFVKGYTVDDDATRKIGKQYQVHIRLELYIESMYKDLVNSKIIHPTGFVEVAETIAFPSIMVLPYSDNATMPQEIIEANPYMRLAISKMNEAFIEKGVETKDLEQMLRNADRYTAMKGDLDLVNNLVINSGADVAVYLDISNDGNAQLGNRVTLTLRAIDAASGRNIASKSEVSGRKKATVDVITSAMIQNMVDDFLRQIQISMANRIDKGNTIAIQFSIDPMSNVNFDMEVGTDYTPLSDAIIGWVKDNAKDGKYHQQGRSETLLSLDEIQIANTDNSDINDFSLGLYRFLRGLNLVVKRTITGNTIEITIQ